MERRKSRQFDGTDVDDQESASGGPSRPYGMTKSPSSSSPGLLRHEVSRAYKEVASAGDAVRDASVDALGVLLRLMEAQVKQSKQ